MKKSQVPDEELQAAWNALDDDDSGFVTAGEFGPFMKSGAPPKGPGWKEKRNARKAAEGKAARAATKAYGDNEVHADVEPATEAELLELSKKMNACLQDPACFPNPGARDWFKVCAPPPKGLLHCHQSPLSSRAPSPVKRFQMPIVRACSCTRAPTTIGRGRSRTRSSRSCAARSSR